MHNYIKAKIITKTNNKLIDHNKILNAQLRLKQQQNAIYVLSTFPLITIDYNYEKTMEIIKSLINYNI